MRLGDLATIKHVIGALLLVPYWPSRRMIRRLEAEVAELHELREFRETVETTASYLVDVSSRCRTNS